MKNSVLVILKIYGIKDYLELIQYSKKIDIHYNLIKVLEFEMNISNIK